MSLKNFIRKRIPKGYVFAQKKWSGWRQRRLENRMHSIGAQIIRKYGSRVVSGPFAGMEYVSRAFKIDRVPMLLGCYESELHSEIAAMATTPYRNIIDVGCAEGYYAVGFGRMFPDARIHAFDIDPAARDLCAAMAKANRVDSRITIMGACEISSLQKIGPHRTLFFCDCEGSELDLLQPDLIPNMRYFDFIVELHDNLRQGISPTIIQRFSPTHYVRVLTARERDPLGYPQIAWLAPEDRKLAIMEFRNGVQQWAVMLAKKAPPGSVRDE
jgi:hypothetical protein